MLLHAGWLPILYCSFNVFETKGTKITIFWTVTAAIEIYLELIFWNMGFTWKSNLQKYVYLFVEHI